MAFHNPLHNLSLNEGARTLTLAMGDWAILAVEPSGAVLPIWKLNHIHDDLIAAHQFTQQDKYQLFDCFNHTSSWCGFLWGMSHRTETLFVPDHLEEVSSTLETLVHMSSKHYSYPYQHSVCWHHPSDHGRLVHSGWIVETMIILSEQDAMYFMESLIVDWLCQYLFDELPSNNDQLTTLDLRRGYMLWLMAMDFEHCALTSPDDCVQFFGRYQKHEALRHRS